MSKVYTIIFLILAFQINAQVVTIGSGTNSTGGVPIAMNYNFTYSQSIYLASEINQPSGTSIYRIVYKGADTLTDADNWTIYIGNTTKNEFADADDWVSVNTLTQVFSGQVTVGSDNTVIVEFTTPFDYNGDNLLIAFDENTNSYHWGNDDFHATSVSDYRTLTAYSDNNNPNPSTPPSGTRKAYIPNIDIDFNATACNELATNLTANTITDTSASLSWSAGGSISNWDVEYGATGFTTGSGNLISSTSESYNLTGLNANTTYDYYVRTNCDSGTSSWVGPYTFTTNCAPFTAPYTQNFDASSELDTCWKTEIVGNNSSPIIRLYSQRNFSSPNSLYLNTSYDDAAGTYYIISPYFSDLDSSKRVKLQIFNDLNSDFTATLELGKLTDKSDYSTYSIIQTIDLTGLTENTWNELTIPLTTVSGTGGHIVFKFRQGSTSANWNNRLYFDDFVYEDIPACLKPANLTSGNITGLVSVDLEWTANNGETSWDIEYGQTGFDHGDGTTISVTENPYTLSNIAENTTFDFYVKANCSTGSSAWSNIGSFTTSDQTIAMVAGVGINTDTPKTALDVNGAIRAINRDDSEILYECNETTEGAMGYDKVDKKVKVCTDENGNGFEWLTLRYAY